MCINGLEKTERDPNINGENVEVAGKVAVEDGTRDRTRAEDKHFCRVGIFGSKTKRCRVLVVKLVNMLVQWSPMKSLVGYTDNYDKGKWRERGCKRTKVVEHVFKHKENGDLGDHGCPGWEGYLVSLHTKRFCHGVEQPNLTTSVSVTLNGRGRGDSQRVIR